MKLNPIVELTTLILITLLSTSLGATTPVQTEKKFIFHNEIVGVLVFEKFSNEQLLLTATLEKKHFVHALNKEGKCEKKDMMKVCGNHYVKENLEVTINGKIMTLNKASMQIERENIVVTYLIDFLDTEINQVEIKSDYMFKYNDHSLLKVIFELEGETRTFNIKNNRRSLIAKF